MQRKLKFLLVLLLAAPVQAQYMNPFTGTNWNNPVSSSIDTILWGDMQSRLLLRPYENRQGQETAVTHAPLPVTATSFMPHPGLATARTLARSFSQDAEEQAQFAELFEIGLHVFDGEARAAGRANNVAMALTYFLVANYYVYSNQEASEQGQEALFVHLNDLLGLDAQFQNLGDAERHELYETFMILGSLPLMLYTSALQEGDHTLAQSVQGLAAENLQVVLGVHPENLHFTAMGLELRQ
jgi:hypothetical protein